ncbi:MAG: pyruvate kinase [Sedimentisphaerales bacterium]|nr:pyruvate kinase [Sedimentisphaerales bacterium]
MIKTKIIATVGPATAAEEILQSLMDTGVDVFRLNFSHGDLAEHARLLEAINRVRARHRHAAAVMGDLCGPKIRTSRIEPDGQELTIGQTVTIQAADETGTAERFGTNYTHLVRDVKTGQRILIDDGQIELEVTDKDEDKLLCRVRIGGPLHSRKGINLPDTQIQTPSLTERDWECAGWAVQNELEYLALSFVRQADEIRQLKDYLRQANSDIKVIAKIEKPQAVENLDAIVQASDAVLVARGDLGVEMDLAEVPLIQKRITALCRQRGKPVVVATQMLQSMIQQPTPTRAEVNDVANAIMDYADAVMLSGETAVGKYPQAAVRTIRRIAKVTERYMDQHDIPRPKMNTEADLALTAALARSVAQIVEDTGAKMVAVWSQTGSTARLLSKARIDVPILAMSSQQRVCGQMALHYGVIARYQAIPADIGALAGLVDRLVLERHWAQIGDQIVLVAGHPLGAAGTTNVLMMHTVTQTAAS